MSTANTAAPIAALVPARCISTTATPLHGSTFSSVSPWQFEVESTQHGVGCHQLAEHPRAAVSYARHANAAKRKKGHRTDATNAHVSTCICKFGCVRICVTNRRELSVPVLAFPSKLSEWKGNTNVSCSRAHDLSLTTRSLVSLLFCPISLSLYLLCSEQLLEFLSETGSQKKQRYFHPKYIGVISRKVLWHWACTTSLSLSSHLGG